MNHTESLDNLARAFDANGAPLSVRIRLGSPYSRNSRSKYALLRCFEIPLCPAP